MSRRRRRRFQNRENSPHAIVFLPSVKIGLSSRLREVVSAVESEFRSTVDNADCPDERGIACLGARCRAALIVRSADNVGPILRRAVIRSRVGRVKALIERRYTEPLQDVVKIKRRPTATSERLMNSRHVNAPLIIHSVDFVLMIVAIELGLIVRVPVPAVPSPRRNVSVVITREISPTPTPLMRVIAVPMGKTVVAFAGIVHVRPVALSL